MKFTLKVLALSVIITTAVLNMQPILALSQTMFALIEHAPFLWLLKTIGLGGLISLLSRIFADIVGIGIWGFLQFCILLPSVIQGNLEGLQILIRSFGRFREEVINPTDSDVVKGLKQRHNNAPKEWLMTAHTLRAVAYLVKFSLVCLQHPPYRGGLQAILKDFPLHASINSIDWSNFGVLLLIMFSFEIVVFAMSWVIRGQTDFKFGKPTKQERYADEPQQQVW
jgi:hypothetical protein